MANKDASSAIVRRGTLGVFKRGFGISSPGSDLEVKSSGDGNNPLDIRDSDGHALFNVRQSGNNGMMRLYSDGGSEKMRIRSSGDSFFHGGNIGIGTTTPLTQLDIFGGAGTKPNDPFGGQNQLFLSNGSTNNAGITIAADDGTNDIVTFLQSNQSSDTGYVGTQTSHNFVIRTNNTDRITVLSGGSVGIGTTSPGKLLELAGGGLRLPNAYSIDWNNENTRIVGSHNSNKIQFDVGGVSNVLYLSNGSVGIGTNAPSRKFMIHGGSARMGIKNTTEGVVLGLLSDDAGYLHLNNGSGTNTIQLRGDTVSYFNAGNVGIGTTTPTGKLTIKSSGNSSYGLEVQSSLDTDKIFGVYQDGDGDGALYLFNKDSTTTVGLSSVGNSWLTGGNFGIGTNSPTLGKLQVVGSGSSERYLLALQSTNNHAQLRIISEASTYSSYIFFQDNSGAADRYVIQADVSDNLLFRPQGTGTAANQIVFNSVGNVGIGTVSPDAKLDVRSTSGSVGLTVGNTTGDTRLQITSSENSDVTLNVGDASGMGTSRSFIFKTGSSERMRIAADGNVGIGTTSPTKLLTVNGQIGLLLSGTARLHMRADSDRTYFEGQSGNGFRFTTTGGGSLDILNGGSVGIGTSSPTATLHVNGSIKVERSLIGISNSSLSRIEQIILDSSAEDLPVINYQLNNDLALLRVKGNTVTYGGLSSNPGDSETDRFFESNSYFGDIAASEISNASTGFTITLDSLPRNLTYTTRIGISFAAAQWRCSYVKIEVYRAGAWTQIREETSNTKATVWQYYNTSSSAITKIRYTIKTPVTTSTRIVSLFAFNYNSTGNSGYFLSQAGGTVYGALTLGEFTFPTTDGTANQVLQTDGSGTLSWSSAGTGTISGSGTDNYIPRFNGTGALENSAIYDNGSNRISLGTVTTSPWQALDVRSTGSQFSDGAGGNQNYNITVVDQNTYTYNYGGGILFGGKYNSSGGVTTLGIVSASKVSGNGTHGGKVHVGGRENNTATVPKVLTVTHANVGIGTTDPVAHLHVSKSAGTTTVLTQVAANSTVGYEIKKTGSTTQHWKIVDGQTVNGTLEFYDATDSATRMAINGSGSVGIGTTSPAYPLDVRTAIQGAMQVKGAQTHGLLLGEAAYSTSALYTGLKTSYMTGVNDYMIISGTTTDGNTYISAKSGGNAHMRAGGNNSTNEIVVSASTGITYKSDVRHEFSTGSVGIGTSSPTTKLHVYGNNAVGSLSNLAAQFSATGTGGLGIGDENGVDPYIGLLVATDDFHIKTGGNNNRVTVQADGNVGIGTNAPGAKLHVRGSDGYLKFDTSGADGTIKSDYNLKLYADDNNNNSSGYQNIQFYTAGANERMRITSDGNVGIGTTSPSKTLEINHSNHEPVLIKSTGNYNSMITMDSNRSSANSYVGGLAGKWNGTQVASIYLRTGSDTTNKDDGYITLLTASSGTLVERMRIQSDGNVGIGTASPAHKFHVLSTDLGAALIDNNRSSTAANLSEASTIYSLSLKNRNGGSYLNFSGSDAYTTIQALQNSTTARNISLNPFGGYVGIGTTSPSYPLQVQYAGGTAIGMQVKGTSSRAKLIVSDNDTSTYLIAEDSMSSIGRSDSLSANNLTINSTGCVGVGTTSPTTKLHIDRASGESWDGNIGLSMTGTMLGKIIVDNDGLKYRTIVSGDGHYFRNAANNTNLVIQDNGRVGIGTTSPATTLHSSGTVRVGTSPFTDYKTSQQYSSASYYVAMATGSFHVADSSNTAKFTFTPSTGKFGIGITSPNETADIVGSIKYGTSGNHEIVYHSTTGTIAGNTLTTINWKNGTSTLDRLYTYKIELYISNDTSTNASAVYVLRDSANYASDTASWNLRMVSRTGTSSNHVAVEVASAGTVIQVKHFHPSSSYPIGYKVTANKRGSQNAVGAAIFGADSMWQRDVGNLYYNDGVVLVGATTSSGNAAQKFQVGTVLAGSSSAIAQIGGLLRTSYIITHASGTAATDHSGVQPASNNTGNLGNTAYRYYGLYSNIGNFSGNVGIGATPNAANKLEVNGQIRSTTAMFGDASLSNVAAKPVHIKVGGQAALRLEDSTSTNLVYDISSDWGIGFVIRDETAGTNRLIIDQSTGDATFSNDVIVTGDLTVNGDTTTVNTTNLLVEDPLIVLAKNQSGTPTLDAGIVVERGDSNNAAMFWDESGDEFRFSITTETGSTAGNVAVTDNANIRAKGATLTGAVNMTGGNWLSFDGEQVLRKSSSWLYLADGGFTSGLYSRIKIRTDGYDISPYQDTASVTSATTLGISTKRWYNVYSQAGDFSGNLTVSGTGTINGVRLGRGWHIANRAGLRLDSNGTAYPADILFGHTSAANESSWNGVYWAMSSRGANHSPQNAFYFYRGSGHASPNNSEATIMTFTPDLKVGINDTNPSATLDVTGTGNFSSNLTVSGTLTNGGFYSGGNGYVSLTSNNPSIRFYESDTTDTNWDVQVNSGTLKFLTLYDNNTNFSEKLTITNAGTVNVNNNLTVGGTITENSSIAFKENVFDFTSPLEKISKVRPVKYNKKTNKDKKEIGLIAEELAEIFPELVENDKDGNPASVNYTRAVTVLFDGFKQMYKELKEIKEKIK